jgi:peptidoglycan/LPS O-acetylase OafA/YrhL
VSHFWSLAVEEHFYLIWPLCVFLLPLDSLAVLCVLVSVVALAVRIALVAVGSGDINVLVLTPCRLDSLCVGALLAVARVRLGVPSLVESARRALAPLALATLGVSLWNLLHGPLAAAVLQTRGTTLAPFFGALIVATVGAPPASLLARVFASRALRTLGKYSYGLYVLHGIVAYGMFDGGIDRGLTRRLGSHEGGMLVFAVGGVTASLFLAVASYELFEKRFPRLKDRLAPTTALPRRFSSTSLAPTPAE